MTSRTRAPRSDGLRNRAVIIEAARAVYAEVGDEVSMAAIAEEAGVAVGTLYNHFPTKVDLLDAVVDEFVRQVADRAEQLAGQVREGEAAGETVIAFLDFVLDISAAHHPVKAAARKLGAGQIRGTDDEARAATALGAILTAAQHEGSILTGITVEDIYLLVDTAPVQLPKPARSRWLDLLTTGISTASP